MTRQLWRKHKDYSVPVLGQQVEKGLSPEVGAKLSKPSSRQHACRLNPTGVLGFGTVVVARHFFFPLCHLYLINQGAGLHKSLSIEWWSKERMWRHEAGINGDFSIGKWMLRKLRLGFCQSGKLEEAAYLSNSRL